MGDMALHRKNRKAAKDRLLDMLLRPQNVSRHLGNSRYNAREYYLVTKYLTKWGKITAASRQRTADRSTIQPETVRRPSISRVKKPGRSQVSPAGQPTIFAEDVTLSEA